MNTNFKPFNILEKNVAKLKSLPGSSLYDFGEIYIKTFTLEDIYILTSITSQEDTKRFLKFIQDHININLYTLTDSDFKFILFWERLNSYPHSPLQLEWKCKVCDNLNISDIDTNNIGYIDLKKDYTKNGLIVNFYGEREGEDEIAIWKIPTLADSEKAQNFIKSKKLEDDISGLVELSICLEFVKERELSLEQKLSKVRNFKADNLMIIESLKEYSNYGIQNNASCSCNNCGEVEQLDFSFKMMDLFPSLPSRGTIQSRISSNMLSNESEFPINTEGGVQQANIFQEKIRKETFGGRGEGEGIEKEINRYDEEVKEDLSSTYSNYSEFIKKK